MSWHFRWYRLREDPRARRAEPLREAAGARWKDEGDPPIAIAALVLGIGIPALVLLTLVALLLAGSSSGVRWVAAAAVVVAAGALGIRASRRRARARREALRQARALSSDR